MSNLERKFGKYAIRNLSLVLIILYLAGYLIYYVNINLLGYLTLNPYAIVHGQIWRLVSWLLIPPSTSNFFFIAIMLFFYYSIGTSLERVWGTWRYNVFIFTGVLLTILSAFVWMGISYMTGGTAGYLSVLGARDYFNYFSIAFSTYYINMGIFFAYALTFPDAMVLMFFIIPIKVKWLGLLDVAYLIYEFVVSYGPTRYVIIATFLNIALLYYRTHASSRRTREWRRRTGGDSRSSGGGRPGSSGFGGSGRGVGGSGIFGSGRQSRSDQNRSAESAEGSYAYSNGPQRGAARRKAMHRCAICGRTELDDPNLEFRYCTKCEGGLEYCQDHLFTHVHVKAGEVPHIQPRDTV